MHEDQAISLIELIKIQAETIPNKIAYTFDGQLISYLQLWNDVEQTASELHTKGIESGQSIMIALSNGQSFFNAFFGCQLLGAIPIPIAPKSSIARINRIATLAKSDHLISNNDPKLYTRHGIQNHNLEENGRNTFAAISFPPIQPSDTAFIQFTSGSTGESKGVPLTHHNLLTNIRQMIVGMEISSKDIFLSWLPVYHDMGLILMVLTPLYLGITTHILPTSLANLTAWLKQIEAQKATFTAAPDFAYRMLDRYIRNPKEIDISSLRVALNAAEPVRQSTIDNFHKIFGIENVMVAGYGLAEATVGVSMWKPSSANKIDLHGVVSVGSPFPDISIKILSDNQPVLTNQVGEIVVKSPANCGGYIFETRNKSNLFWGLDYIRTGDLGYLDEEGNLYIVGRKKQIIKVAGRTIAPRELEELVDLIAKVRMSAVVGIDSGDRAGEQIYIFAELRRVGKSAEEERIHEDLVMAIVNSIHDQIQIRPARVLLLKSNSIPKTHNGKTQYGKLRQHFLQGKMEEKIIFSS